MRFAMTVVLATGLVCAGWSHGRAQGIDPSTIAGTVTDATGAVLPDTSVFVQSRTLIGGPRTTITDGRGEYRIDGLTSGVYEVVASRSGFTTTRRADIRLPGEKTLIVDMRLDVAGVGERVAVTAPVPLIDVRTAASPVVLDSDLLDHLPTDRVVANVMNLVPGVNVWAGFGGTQQSNPLYLDGVNTSDPQTLKPRAMFNYNWVQEIQVAGPGANAEYGDFSGVVQTMTLRSGGNRISGLGEYQTTRPTWTANNTASLASSVQNGLMAASSQRVVAWRDANAQLGGPLLKDRLWYFGGLQHFRNDVRPALLAGEDSIDERDRRMLAKITSAPRTGLRVEGFYAFARYQLINAGLAPDVRPEATTTDTMPNHTWNTRATWVLGPRTTFELRNGGFTGRYTADPAGGTRSGPPAHLDVMTNSLSVNAWNYYDWNASRNVVAGVFNAFRDSRSGGRHELKFGAEFEHARNEWVLGFPGGRQYLDWNGAPFQVRLASESHQLSRIHRTTVFGQNTWSAAGNLTFQFGLRASINRGIVSQGTVLPTTPLDPRIGFAWDASHDHKTVVRGHYGRYHDALLTAHFSALDAEPQPAIVTAAVTGPDQLVELSRSSASMYGIDPKLSAAYFDQYLVGLERELWPHWAFIAQVVRRDYRDLVGVLDTGTVYEAVQRQDPGSDGRLGTSDDGGFVTAYRNTNSRPAFYYITNPESAYRRYTALQLIARKQYARNWQMQASYALSSTRGNIDNSTNSNADGPENGYNGIFANPNRAIYADGSTLFDFTHEVKVLSTWRVPIYGGVIASTVYRYHTGAAWARSALLPGILATFQVRMEPRGSRRTDALSQLDVRLEKTVPLRGVGRLGMFADIFNINNQGVPDPSRVFAVEFRSGSTFGQPLFWTAPRTVRAGIRLTFD